MKAAFNQDPSLAGVDSGEQFNFKCKYCLRNLSSRQNLREHIYIHTGEKPYMCTELGCGQSFRQGSLLSIHKKIHSEISKGLKQEKKSERRCQYPKLTELLHTTSGVIDEENQEFKKEELIGKIGEETFMFVQKFLKTLN